MAGRKKLKGTRRRKKVVVLRPSKLSFPSSQLGGMVFSPVIRKFRRKRKAKRRNY